MSHTPESKDFSGHITKGYTPRAYYSGWFYVLKAPAFTFNSIQNMLLDPRIRFGLQALKGPILADAKFKVQCDNEEVRQFIIDTVTRFWRTSILRVLKALEWGYSCSEIIYRMRNGQIEFSHLEYLHSLDCRPLILEGKVVGASVRNVKRKNVQGKAYFYAPKCFWHVHNREINPFFGQSQLHGAYLPWIEKWDSGGQRDCRRLFYHKYAFNGGVMHYPPGETQVNDSVGGEAMTKNNQDIAREIMDKKRTGGTVCLPSLPTTDIGGANSSWAIDPPETIPPPTGMMEYGHDLSDEELEGMGIPPEVLAAAGTGAYAGRAIPQQAFYAGLNPVLQEISIDLSTLIVEPLVAFRYGTTDFEIIPFPLNAPSEPETAEPSLPEKNLEGEAYCHPMGNPYEIAMSLPIKDNKGNLHVPGGNPSGGQFTRKTSGRTMLSASTVGEILADQFHNKAVGRTAEDLRDRWIDSENFHLMEIPIDMVSPATPTNPNDTSFTEGPLIVDKNKTGAGRISGQFGPPGSILILDGKHRHAQAIRKGKNTIQAYVGEKAIPEIQLEIRRRSEEKSKISLLIDEFCNPANTSPGSTLRKLKSLISPERLDEVRAERKRRLEK